MSAAAEPLEAGRPLSGLALDLPVEPVGSGQAVAGAPCTGSVGLGGVGAVRIGVWEMTTGSMVDVEIEETFVVVEGRARVEFLDPPLPEAQLEPGSIMRFDAGMKTRWTVTTPRLRKFYLVS